ncbi:MAG: DUF2071 domain-containing protein [Planctomyces sp.]|nr:DUF2071 domain-containing protein [Planctomyces sp.]
MPLLLDDQPRTWSRRQPPPADRRRPLMRHTWRNLLFLHWRFPPELISPRLPGGLTLETFDGSAWVGIVPFFMRNIRLRGTPALPFVSNFLELNLRTYAVADNGVSGVWFLSLDANQPLAVWGARTFYHLPYEHAAMRAWGDVPHGRVAFQSHRRRSPHSLTCRFEYAPSGPARLAEPDTLEHFLIERYTLFACRPDGLLRSGLVQHPPYEISDVQLGHWDEHLLELNGLTPAGRPPDHAVMSLGVDVDVWPLEPIGPPKRRETSRPAPERLVEQL